MFNKTKNFMQV